MKDSKANKFTIESETNNERHMIFATCLLKGAIPSSIIRDLKKDYYFALGNPMWAADVETFNNKQFLLQKYLVKQIDNLLDKRKIGPYYLHDKENAEILKHSLKKINNEPYKIVTFKILSNHFHLLIEIPALSQKQGSLQILESKLANLLLRRIKKNSAEKINANLCRIGPLWEEENLLLNIDSEMMLQNVLSYIKSNTCYLERQSAFKTEVLLSKTINTKGKRTLVYSEFRPGIVG